MSDQIYHFIVIHTPILYIFSSS